MILSNIWNNIVEWFSDRSERGKLVRSFNTSARDAFIQGTAPTLLKASISKGSRKYHHQFSAWFNTGFRIQATGRTLSKDEKVFIGQTVLHDELFVRRLIALGWDTLEIYDDTGIYGCCRWNLMNYANENKQKQTAKQKWVSNNNPTPSRKENIAVKDNIQILLVR